MTSQQVISVPAVTVANESATHNAVISYRGCSSVRLAHEMESAVASVGLRPWHTIGRGARGSCPCTPDSWHVPVINNDRGLTWPTSASGVWPHQTSATVVSYRPWSTLLTFVLWQSLKMAYNFCMSLAMTQPTDWRMWWLQLSQNERKLTQHMRLSSDIRQQKRTRLGKHVLKFKFIWPITAAQLYYNSCWLEKWCCTPSTSGLKTFFGTSRSWRLSVSASSRSREFVKIERLGLVSVSRVCKNRTSWSHLGLEGSTSRSQSRSRDFSLVNMHAMRYHEENNGSDPQETGCQVTDFTSWCF